MEVVEYTRWVDKDESLNVGEYLVRNENGNTVTRLDAEQNQLFKVKGTKRIEVNSIYWDMARKYQIQKRLERYCKENLKELAIQGEIVGTGIQKNTLGLSEIKLLIFDIFNIQTQRYVNSRERQDIINTMNEYDDIKGEPLEQVPIIGYKTITPNCDQLAAALGVTNTQRIERQDVKGIDAEPQKQWLVFLDATVDSVVKDLLKMAEGQVFTGKNHPREGLVFKSLMNPMVSFKVINNTFLLKHDA